MDNILSNITSVARIFDTSSKSFYFNGDYTIYGSDPHSTVRLSVKKKLIIIKKIKRFSKKTIFLFKYVYFTSPHNNLYI